jgi:hypothetical protein
MVAERDKSPGRGRGRVNYWGNPYRPVTERAAARAGEELGDPTLVNAGNWETRE